MDNLNNYITLHALVNSNLEIKEYEEIKNSIRKRLNEINIKHATIELEFISYTS